MRKGSLNGTIAIANTSNSFCWTSPSSKRALKIIQIPEGAMIRGPDPVSQLATQGLSETAIFYQDKPLRLLSLCEVEVYL